MNDISYEKWKGYWDSLPERPKSQYSQRSKKNKVPHISYKARDIILLSMGYSSYNSYLNSDFWLDFRDWFLKRYSKCYLCGQSSQCIHHKSYDKATLQLKVPQNLIPLCNPCHYLIEFKNKRKVNGEQANQRLDIFKQHGVPHKVKLQRKPNRKAKKKRLTPLEKAQESLRLKNKREQKERNKAKQEADMAANRKRKLANIEAKKKIQATKSEPIIKNFAPIPPIKNHYITPNLDNWQAFIKRKPK